MFLVGSSVLEHGVYSFQHQETTYQDRTANLTLHF